MFFSGVKFVCWLLFSVHSTTVLQQWHIKDPGHSVKCRWQVTPTHIHPWPHEVGVSWLCRCPGIVWEPIRKQAHTQFIREHSVTVISAHWATVDWSWPKEWNSFAWANLHFKKKKHRRGMNCRTFSQNPRKRWKSHHLLTSTLQQYLITPTLTYINTPALLAHIFTLQHYPVAATLHHYLVTSTL